MSKPRPPAALSSLRPLLEEIGLPWRIENGRKHWRLYLCDRVALVLPHGSPKTDLGNRHRLNNEATIRRVAKELTAKAGPA